MLSRRATGAFVLCLAFTAASLPGCSPQEPAPLGPSATWLVEAPPVAAGNPFEMVLFVRTPAGHRAHAYSPPSLGGLEIVERRILPISSEGEVVVHREALLARARSAGLHRWPASEVLVTGPTGDTYALELSGLEFDVPSVFGEGAPPRRPRGYRAPPSPPLPGGFGAGFAAGVAVMGVLLILAIRRERRRAADAHLHAAGEAAAPRRHIGGPGRLRRRLDEARAAASSDADEAGAQAALALRFWAADRFLVSTHAPSSEELRRARPEHVAAHDWAAWVDRLAEVERARFAARSDADRAASMASAIEAALEFADAIDRPVSHDDEVRADRETEASPVAATPDTRP